MIWLVIIVFGLLIPEILSTVLDSRIGRAVAAQIESRGKSGSGSDPEPLLERIRYLEGEIDRLSGDVQKLRDESEFFQRLLTERSSEGGSPPTGGDRST